MRKTWMLASSFAVSTVLVLAPTVFAAVNNNNSNTSTATRQSTSSTDSSNFSSGMESMMGSNGAANMMNNPGVQKMMGAMSTPQGQKMVNDCSNFMSSYSKSNK